MKKYFLIAAMSVCTMGFLAQSEDVSDESLPPPPPREQQQKQWQNSKIRRMENPEMKARREMGRKLVEAYKADPTDANKAALREFCAKQFDMGQENAEKRLAEMKKHLAEIEKRTQDAKINKEKMIDEHMERLLNPHRRDKKFNKEMNGENAKKGEKNRKQKCDKPQVCPQPPEED